VSALLVQICQLLRVYVLLLLMLFVRLLYRSLFFVVVDHILQFLFYVLVIKMLLYSILIMCSLCIMGAMIAPVEWLLSE
jgi:hypothetical protein